MKESAQRELTLQVENLQQRKQELLALLRQRGLQSFEGYEVEAVIDENNSVFVSHQKTSRMNYSEPFLKDLKKRNTDRMLRTIDEWFVNREQKCIENNIRIMVRNFVKKTKLVGVCSDVTIRCWSYSPARQTPILEAEKEYTFAELYEVYLGVMADKKKLKLEKQKAKAQQEMEYAA